MRTSRRSGRQHWLRLLQARAIENQAYVVGANRVGSDPYYTYNGRSVIIDPQGEIVADARDGKAASARSWTWRACGNIGRAALPGRYESPLKQANYFLFLSGVLSARVPRMPEIVAFVNRGAASITPAIVEKVIRHLPQWKLEFTQIYEPLFPAPGGPARIPGRLASKTPRKGAYKDLPYTAFAQAVFALIYAHKKVGIIPDSVLNLGRADDSSVVRAVLIQNEKAFAVYAATQNTEWSRITSQP